MAAVAGSLVGGSATIATTWITQRTSIKRELISEELRKRETLYGEFINECSKLAIDSLAEAEAVLKRIAEQYFSPNVSLDEFRTIALSQDGDPLKSLGEACRFELQAIRGAR